MSADQAPAAGSRRLVRAAAWVAPTVCFLFGALLLIFVMGPADGVWQLYAELMLKGERIYSDLGLNQQPLFFLFSELSLRFAPDTILGQRIVFFVVLALYVYAINFISRLVTTRWVERAVVQLAVFFTAIHAEYFRFDDYHALAHLGVLASITSSILFVSDRQSLTRYSFVQGLLATLVFLTRINEGMAIVASAGLIVLVRHGLSRDLLRFVGLGLLAALAILFTSFLLIGETPATWFRSSLMEASSAKGGTSLARYPYQLIFRSFAHFDRLALLPLPLLLASIPIGLIVAWFWLRTARWFNVLCAVTCILLMAVVLTGYSAMAMATLTPLVFLGLLVSMSAWAAVRVFRPSSRNRTDRSLFFYPLFLFVFGSLSTAGEIGSLYFPVAVALLLFPLVLDRVKSPLIDGARVGFVLLCAFLAVGGAWTRYQNPYAWINLRSDALGSDKSYRSDPRRGGHFISAELAALIDPVCARVGSNDTMLSTPFSFANYYCGVPTWRGYVQTWFDLSTEVKIGRLLNDLRRDPPDYVFYQRQEGVLRAHEKVFHEGRSLPYRKLHSFIRERVDRGDWEVIYQSRLYPDSHWLLLRTVPAPRSDQPALPTGVISGRASIDAARVIR